MPLEKMSVHVSDGRKSFPKNVQMKIKSSTILSISHRTSLLLSLVSVLLLSLLSVLSVSVGCTRHYMSSTCQNVRTMILKARYSLRMLNCTNTYFTSLRFTVLVLLSICSLGALSLSALKWVITQTNKKWLAIVSRACCKWVSSGAAVGSRNSVTALWGMFLGYSQ